MIIESGENTTLRNSPFKSEAWLKSLGSPFKVFKAISSNKEVASVALNFNTLSKAGLKLRTLTTPMWALDCGLSGDVSEKAYEEILVEILREKSALKVVDLPPSISRELVEGKTPSGFKILWTHTRQVSLPCDLPSNRRKQLRRASRESIHGTEDNWDEVIKLHASSRERKNISHDNEKFTSLIKGIEKEENTFAVCVSDSEGNTIASGGFLIIDKNTCLYAFGGQKRSKHSGIASVVLLDEAMKIAERKGCEVFDFGGSADPGVDRFYKEFNAEKVEKARLVSVSWWLRPVLRFIRPDLS